jgi:cytochrome P450
VRRAPTKHLGFGYGPLVCVGAALGRLGAPMMLGALIDRFESITLAAPVRMRDNIVMRGPERLELELR